MTKFERGRVPLTSTVVRITNHIKETSSKSKTTNKNNEGTKTTKPVVDTKNSKKNSTTTIAVPGSAKKTKETKPKNTTPKTAEVKGTITKNTTTTTKALPTRNTTPAKKALLKEKKSDEIKKEKVGRVTGQKTKRANDTKKDSEGNPQKKKKENMNQSKKGKEKTNDSYELKIIDDPLNYIPDIENEEYEAEFIVSHKVYKSKVINYVIKWKGWDHKDNTTEKASTIHADVPSLCRAYWSKMEPSQVLSNVVEFTKKDGGISAAASKNLEYRKKTYSNKHIRPLMAVNGFIFNPKWPNISTNWEADMKKITSVLPSVLDEKLLFGYIEWINGQRTVHFITDLHKHCPEKLISYYEDRLRIF